LGSATLVGASGLWLVASQPNSSTPAMMMALSMALRDKRAFVAAL